MIPGSYVLLSSPLTAPFVWGRLPDLLHGQGFDVVVVDVSDDDEPPFADRYVAGALAQIASADPRLPAVLVAHSGAGPLLPPLGTLLPGDQHPGGYVFLDAGLPGSGGRTRVDLLRDEGGGFADAFLESLRAGARFPAWTVDDLADILPDLGDRVALVQSLRPRGHDFFVEPLPEISGWPDAACGYLRTSAAYDVWRTAAEQRGWPVMDLDLGHFAALADPDATLEGLLELTARLASE